MATGVNFYHPVPRPLASLTRAMPLATYNFFLTGGSNQALVYRDAFLKYPYSGQPQADAAGNFSPIYLDPRIVYRVQLVDANGVQQYSLDPYIPSFPATGSGPIQIDPICGEVQINPPVPSNPPSPNNTTLTISRNSSVPIQCPGTPFVQSTILQFVNTLTTGQQIATFSATNKPGAGGSAPSLWLPITGDGGISYYLPLWI